MQITLDEIEVTIKPLSIGDRKKILAEFGFDCMFPGGKDNSLSAEEVFENTVKTVQWKIKRHNPNITDEQLTDLVYADVHKAFNFLIKGEEIDRPT